MLKEVLQSILFMANRTILTNYESIEQIVNRFQLSKTLFYWGWKILIIHEYISN